jgi:hypothetical protein
MSRVSITKIFTLVSFFIVTAFGNPGFAATTPAACLTKVKGITVSDVTNCSKDGGFETAADIEACSSAKQACSEAKSDARDDKAEKREADKTQDAACQEAFKTYKEKMGEAQSACEGLVGSSASTKKNCSAKLEECASAMANTSTQYADSQDDNGMTGTLNIFRAVVSGQDSLGTSGGSSCLVDVDSQAARDAEKDFRERRDKLKDEKKQIEDDAIKDKKENDTENTRIAKEIEELKIENKKLAAETDVKIREGLNESQKAIQASAKALLALQKNMRTVGDKVKSATFSYSDRMLSMTGEKRNQRCKQALDTAKDCLIKGRKGIVDEACKGFPLVIRSKGPKATAELKAQLQTVNNACYEKEEQDRKKAEFENEQQMKSLNDQLTDLQDEARDQAKTQERESQNSQKIQEEAERQKNEAAEALAEKTATLQKEMSQFAEELASKNYRAQERLKKLAEDLQALEVEEKTGKRSKTAIATAAVRKTNADLDEVRSQCDCKNDLSPAPASSTTSVRSKVCIAAKGTLPSGGSTKRSSGPAKSGY